LGGRIVVVLRSKTARVAAFGFLVFWVGLAAAMIQVLIARGTGSELNVPLYVNALVVVAVTGMLLSLTATIVGIVGWIRRRVLLKSGISGLAAFGLMASWIGVLWQLIWVIQVTRHAPPGVAIEPQFYYRPRILILVGLAILMTATLVDIAGWTYRRVRVTSGSANAHRASNP
jgi:hypothetical protein